jgi:hypothetical protein
MYIRGSAWSLMLYFFFFFSVEGEAAPAGASEAGWVEGAGAVTTAPAHHFYLVLLFHSLTFPGLA